MMIKILFVCHGNICRSPMAEFVMKKMVNEMYSKNTSNKQNIQNFEIASAATSTEEIGNPVYPPVKRILNAHGINCNGKQARQMTIHDYDYYDYIVLMDKNNLRNLRWILPAEIYNQELSTNQEPNTRKKISLLMDWTNHPHDVADPWYTGNFDATWHDINEGCKALLNRLI